MARLPKSLLRRGLGKVKIKPDELREMFPELGGMFGPREGFYSKAEREFLALQSKQTQPMSVDQLIAYLKKQGVKDIEINALDLPKLSKVYGDQKLGPDEIAMWMVNRRPSYTEEVEAGRPGMDTDDYSAEDWWDQARAEYIEDQMDYWRETAAERYSVEPLDPDEFYVPSVGDSVELEDLRLTYIDTGDGLRTKQFLNEDGEPVLQYDRNIGQFRYVKTGEVAVPNNHTYVDRENHSWDPDDLRWDDASQSFMSPDGYLVDEEPRYGVIDEYSDSEPLETFDDEADAESYVSDMADSEANENANYLEAEEVQSWVEREFGGIQGWAEARDLYSEPDLGESAASMYGIEPERVGTWYDYHYAGTDDKDFPEPGQMTNWIQQVEPQPNVQRDALNSEIQALEDERAAIKSEAAGYYPEDIQKLKNIEREIEIRRDLLREVDRNYPSGLFRGIDRPHFEWDTHWPDTENPVQHIRGFYDVEEAEPRALEGQFEEIKDYTDAERAGWSFDVQQIALNDNQDMNRLRVEIRNPNGQLVSQRTTPARSEFSDDNTWWNNAYRLGEHETVNVANGARLYDLRHPSSSQEPTGRRGLAVSELQADLAQQLKNRKMRPSSFMPRSAEGQMEMLGDIFPKVPPKEAAQYEEYQRRIAQNKQLKQQHGIQAPDPERINIPAIYRRDYMGIGDPEFLQESLGLQEFRKRADTSKPPGEDGRYPTLIEDVEEGAGDASLPYGSYRTERITDRIRKDPTFYEQYRLMSPEYQKQLDYDLKRLDQYLRGNKGSYFPTSSNRDAYWDFIERLEQMGVDENLIRQIPNPYSRMEALREIDVYQNRIDHQLDNPDAIDASMSGTTAPQVPVSTDERYLLGAKRALLEAAHADQDFLAWPYADTVIAANSGSGAKSFPYHYGLFSGTPQGQIEKDVLQALKPYKKELGGKPKVQRSGLVYPKQTQQVYDEAELHREWQKSGKDFEYNSADKMAEKSGHDAPRKMVYLTKEAREAIKKKGFPFYMLPPFMAGVLSEYGEDYEFAPDVL